MMKWSPELQIWEWRQSRYSRFGNETEFTVMSESPRLYSERLRLRKSRRRDSARRLGGMGNDWHKPHTAAESSVARSWVLKLTRQRKLGIRQKICLKMSI